MSLLFSNGRAPIRTGATRPARVELAKRARELSFSKPNTLPESYKSSDSLDTFGLIPAPQFIKDWNKRQAENQTRRAFANPVMDKADRMAMEAVMGSVGGPANAVESSAAKLARELSGISLSKRATNEFIRVGTKLPQTVKKVAVTRYNSVTDMMKELAGVGQRSLQGTIETKSKGVLEGLHNMDINGMPLIQHMEDAGLAPFRSIAETMHVTPNATEIAMSGRPVLSGIGDAANRSIDTMRGMSPEGFNIKSIEDILSGQTSHLYENDHMAASSIAKQIIGDSAKRIIGRGKGQLTSDWHSASQKALDFVDSPTNLRRVARWWNQGKSNFHPDTVIPELHKQFPALKNIITDTGHLDELVSQWKFYEEHLRDIPGGGKMIDEAGSLAKYAEGVPRAIDSWLFK